MSAERTAAQLAAAKARLDPLGLYPRPVSLAGVRLVSAPWLFRLPGMRRFRGWSTWKVVLVRPGADAIPDDLVVHELCHVWQMQHHPVAMPLAMLRRGYARNPFELEARRAAAVARAPGS